MTSDWYKSSYSPNTGDCVECRRQVGTVDLRDTKNREAGHLAFDRVEWSALLAGVRAGR
ncbi:DUF397 domain-containing protein [Nocardiopsis lambiniae]|uniref:DUF397 domain-containing protein n=1 Tax=Nocardiopsis lambiniae TaxID=3075539 RepID=A0ABU2MBB0_9ACTN|nr:DUF397 domain-containing protein [Nocardiopsis sp. DSM 44743]MDT0329963.1 DUF397 domain-containing protein [Nocardiopsis sp. DSM 44743]